MMKRFLQLMMVVICLGFSFAAMAEDYTMPKKDGFIAEKTVDGDITFYDMGGPSGSVPGYYAGYVRFVPANEGDLLTITFDELDLGGSAKLYIYDGDAGFTSYYGTLKDGYIAELSGSTAGQSYTATSGQLSVLYYGKGSCSGAGWKATVSSASPKDMAYVSTDVIGGLDAVNRGAKNQKIFGVNVLTDGSMNALTLNSLTIDCSALTGSTQVQNVRLYRGDISDASLVATAAAVGDNLSAENVTLKNKANNFFVVADIMPDASGEIPSLKIASVNVAGEARTPLSEQGAALAVGNVIWMPSTATTFTIGDDTEFYDDGGKNGKISSKFTGQVTFVPATAGSKVKIDFTKLAIFNTSSTGLNDVLKIYNGTTATEENLLTTLLTESSKVVKSTADDGALTVTLVSTTGVPADGWEATVSQFIPGDMTFKSVSGQSASTATVSAGDTDAQMLVVNVATDNQSNPLSVSDFALNLPEGTDAAIIGKVKVYSLGENNKFATTKLFGEGVPADGKVKVNGECSLVEGNNYFAVVLDVEANATNAQTVGLALESVTVAGVAQQPAEAVSATRTVNNVCHATSGSHTHTIYGDWTFTDTKSTIYPTKYEYTKDDYIVTFKPSQSGSMIVLDFSKFDLTYSDSSYGTKAVFEVYSGTATTEDALLWKLSSAAQATTGPGKKLYSASDDGAITVKFNPNTISSYYAATGWEATVSQFTNHDMTVKSVEVTQASTANLTPGSTGAEVLKVKIVTEGTLSSRVLKSVKLNLKDSQKSLSKVTVLSSGSDDDFSKATTVFGSATEMPNDELNINGELTLKNESNYLWITTDVDINALSGDVVDASLLSLTTDAGVETVANGDPDGVRTIKNERNLASGDNGVVIVKTPLVLYDDGGADGNFSQGFSGTITFVPASDDALVTVNATAFATGSAKLYVYSGREVNSANLLGTSTYYSGTTGPENLSSKAADGSVTIKFETTSYGSQLSGFALEIGVRNREAFTVSAAEAGAASEKTKAVRGISNAEMVKVKVSVSGDKTPLSVDSFKFTTEGTTSVSDIAGAHLYYTGTTNNFAADNLVASATVGSDGTLQFVPASELTLGDCTDYYFWLAYDVNADAVVGNVLAAKLTSLSIGGAEVAAEKVTSVSASRTVNAGISGEYTIGASSDADYATIAAAVEALADGVEGAVTFKIEDGTYKENVMIANIEGTSAERTIKFTSKSGNRDNVIIAGSTYSEPAYGETKMGMLAVVGTPYVTLEGVSVIPTDQSFPYAVHIYNQSRHFTLKNCVVKADAVTTGYSGMSLVKSEALNEDGKNNDYLTIEDCSFDGGYIALYLGGTSYVALTKERGLVVKNNTVKDAGSKGIYVNSEIDALIEGNSVTSTKTQKTSYSSMDIYRCTGNLVVRNNYCLNTQTAYSNGLYLREVSGSEETPALVYNNVVSLTASPNNNSSAVYLSVESNNVKLLHNSVGVWGTSGYAFYIGGSAKNLNLKNVTIQNNLLQSNCTEATATLYLNEQSYLSGIKFANNAYYYKGDSKLCKDFATTLEDYASVTGDNTSFIEAADFLSETDLRLKAKGNLCSAAVLADVTTDFNGKTRSTETPTIGAYEYEAISADAPEIAEGYPVAGTVTDTAIDVKTKWSVGGKLYAKIVKSTEAAPTADELLAATAVDCLENTEVTTSFTDLEQTTAYKAYFLVQSALNVNSSVVASAEITTARTITKLKLDITSPYDMIDAGASSTITPTVEGGDLPYTYEWRNQMNEVVGNEATLTVSPAHTSAYSVTVTSADGQSVSAKTAVYVSGSQASATFDDNYLATESYWNGDADTGDTFYSGSFEFSNYKISEWSYWEGFAYANSHQTTYTTLADQYRNVVGGGVDGSDSYAVLYSGYYSVPTITVTNNIDGDVVKGVYVTNTPYAVKSMSEGDGYTKKFATGDFFKVIFTGYDSDNNTKQVECYLADYTSETESEHYMLNTWKWVDLSKLGTVTKITVSTIGSQSGIPSYCAIDNLGAADPSGIEDVKADGINIYPVPAVDVLHIDGVGAGKVARIFSISGQLAGEYQLTEDATIDVSALASGVYVIQIGAVKKQFVKM